MNLSTNDCPVNFKPRSASEGDQIGPSYFLSNESKSFRFKSQYHFPWHESSCNTASSLIEDDDSSSTLSSRHSSARSEGSDAGLSINALDALFESTRILGASRERS